MKYSATFEMLLISWYLTRSRKQYLKVWIEIKALNRNNFQGLKVRKLEKIFIQSKSWFWNMLVIWIRVILFHFLQLNFDYKLIILPGKVIKYLYLFKIFSSKKSHFLLEGAIIWNPWVRKLKNISQFIELPFLPQTSAWGCFIDSVANWHWLAPFTIKIGYLYRTYFHNWRIFWLFIS